MGEHPMTTYLKNVSTELMELNEDQLDQICGGEGKEPYSDLYLRPATITEKLKAAGVLD